MGSRLSYLEKAVTSYSRDVPEEAKQDFQELKEALLNTLRVLFEKCRSEFWINSRKFGVTGQETARALEFMTTRDCKTKQEMCSK